VQNITVWRERSSAKGNDRQSVGIKGKSKGFWNRPSDVYPADIRWVNPPSAVSEATRISKPVLSLSKGVNGTFYGRKEKRHGQE
jgi:hypothetical protein